MWVPILLWIGPKAQKFCTCKINNKIGNLVFSPTFYQGGVLYYVMFTSVHTHTHTHSSQINEVMENEPYRVARELLERFDPNNPQLKTTPARPQHGQRRAPNQTPAHGTEVRQRRQQQTPHPVLMQRPVVMATPQVNRPQPPPPVAMVTPAAGVSTNQNAPSAQSQGAMTQEQASVASSQQFIPPGTYFCSLSSR